jgi:hypothetical protein
LRSCFLSPAIGRCTAESVADGSTAGSSRASANRSELEGATAIGAIERPPWAVAQRQGMRAAARSGCPVIEVHDGGGRGRDTVRVLLEDGYDSGVLRPVSGRRLSVEAKSWELGGDGLGRLPVELFHDAAHP